MSTLVGRALCKDHANISQTDAQFDAILDSLRETVSRQAEDITGRHFASGVRTEYHNSFTQNFGDPTPQWLFVEAPPIDTGQTMTLVWAPFDDHTNNGTTLVQNEDWRLETRIDGTAVGLRIQRFKSVPNTFPLPAGVSFLLGDSPTGFQFTYTGGYAVSAVAGAPPAGKVRDPFTDGEGDVVAVPAGLQAILAAKVAENWKYVEMATRTNTDAKSAFSRGDAGVLRLILDRGLSLGWTDVQKVLLAPYARGDRSWIR